eukprot:evm.model.scf_2257.2 EVM.evm.TU.scf_2257.2   scf_2257:17261-25571(+)
MPASAVDDAAAGETAGAAAVAGSAEALQDPEPIEVGAIPLGSAEPSGENGTTSTADGEGNDAEEASSAGSDDAPSASGEPEGIDAADAPYKKGDIVVGRTLWCNERGAKVELLDHEGHQGFVSRRDYPYRLLKSSGQSFHQTPKSLLIGYIREYQIIDVPDRIIPGKRGPLLSARELDRKLMMDRMLQIYDVCQEDREVWTTQVFSVNKGGLKVLLAGRACFIPKSHIVDDEIKNMSQEEFLQKYRGKELEVAVLQVDPVEDRVLLSNRRAEQFSSLRKLRPGALVWGTVRRVLDWGAFIGVDGTQESALIHKSNISKGRFSRVSDVFEVGDRVCAVILGLEEDFSRISCSTAALEQEPGDMVKDRQYVYEHAEEQVERIRGILAEEEENMYSEVDDHEEYAE